MSRGRTVEPGPGAGRAAAVSFGGRGLLPVGTGQLPVGRAGKVPRAASRKPFG